MKFIAPEIDLRTFTCPYCNTLARQEWSEVYINMNNTKFEFFKTYPYPPQSVLKMSTCNACLKYHLWFDDKMLIPDITSIPMPNDDMPDDVKAIYFEARDVISKSPKASAALLRLALQILCKHLGGDGENINSDIGKFVKNGLDTRVQKALDIVRISGNNAVHPGTLDMADNPDIAYRIFGLLNFIVDGMITQPKLIDSFFEELPSGAKNAIAKRDKEE